MQKYLLSKSTRSLVRNFWGAFILVEASLWATTRFPVHEPYSVFFTLNSLSGKQDTTIITEGITVAVCSLLLAGIWVIFIKLIEQKFSICGARKKLLHTLFPRIIVFICICFALWILNFAGFMRVAVNFYLPAKTSEFYEREYIDPKGKVSFPENKRNLIVIFLESFESSYRSTAEGGVFSENLIPQLSQFSTDPQYINFSENDFLGGGKDVAGTNWTVAAICAKFTGVPYAFTMRDMKKSGGGKFLPSAVNLNDILADAGYKQLFLFGSDKHFAHRNIYFETHSNVAIHDLNYYHNANMISEESKTFWGFDDAQLYECAKTELAELSTQNAPWFLGFLTLDLHMPAGFPSHDMEIVYTDKNAPAHAQMKNIVLDTDKKLATFLNWCKNQSWYENTTIVLFGDHAFMDTKKTAFFDIDPAKADRRWFDLFVNGVHKTPDTAIVKNRQFSSLDMFPTILSALGCKIDGNRLGLGVDLFSGQQTLLEKYGLEKLNYELMKKNTRYQGLIKADERTD